MNLLAKNLLAGFTVASLAVVGAVTAEDDLTQKTHKVIEIKAKKDQDVNIVVENDGVSETIVFSHEELQDPVIIEDKLIHLDDDTRETVRQAVNNLTRFVEGDLSHDDLVAGEGHKVVVLNKGEGKLMKLHGGDIDVEVLHGGEGHKMVRKHVIVGGDGKVLKGHTDAIVGLIEKGEFSQDELDQIQAAIDAKR